jgi:hypothetical protein
MASRSSWLGSAADLLAVLIALGFRGTVAHGPKIHAYSLGVCAARKPCFEYWASTLRSAVKAMPAAESLG